MAYTLGKAAQNSTQTTAPIEGVAKTGYYPGKASQNGGDSIPQPSARSLADIASAEKYGATFGASTENASPLGEAAKTVGNIPSSAWQMAKGTLDIINPISTAKKIGDIATGFGSLTKETGGVGSALGAVVKETPSTLKNVIPESWRGLALAGKGLVTGNQGEITQGLETAQRTITNDPVGQILPAVVLARGGAHLADKAATRSAMADYAKAPYSTQTIPKPITKYGDAFDTGMTKVSEAVTKPIGFVAKKVGGYAKGAVESGISQTTGLGKETGSRVTAFPEAFTKKSIAETDRASIGQKVQSELSKLSEEKIATGKEYGPIRTSGQQVRVADDFFVNTIKETTGLDIKGGKLVASGTSKLRDAGDVRAVQRVYDFWKPSFKKGVLTADEFLNFREDLAKMAKFEKDIGVRKDVGALSGIMRAKFNEAYRPQIGGLKELDASMSSQLKEFKELTKGLVDKEGNMTDAGMAKIANLSANKPNLAIQLEKIVPGITEQIKNLQAITDIERASGIKAFKTGTYVRGALTGGAFLGAGIPAGVLTMILTDPAIAVPLLRQYGLLKNARAVNTVINALKKGATDLNQITAGVPKPLTKDVGQAYTDINKTMAGKGGLSMQDVSKQPLNPKTNLGK